MFTRHIRKFTSSRQVKEAYLNGTLATPYIAFVDSSNNVEFAQEYYGTPPEVSYDKLSPYAWTSDYVPTEDASGNTVIEVTINQNSEFYTKLFPYLQVCYFYENERPEGDLDEFLSAHIVGTYLLDPFGSEVETYQIPYDSEQNEYPLNMYARFVDASVSADPVTGDDVYEVTASDGWKYISNYTGAEPEYDYYCTINNLTEDSSTFIATATISVSNGYYYGNYMKVMYGIYTAAELAAAQEEQGFDLKTWQMTKLDSSVAVSPELEMTVTAQLPTPSAGEEIEGYMVCCPYNEDDQEYADIAVLPVAAWSVSADEEPVPDPSGWNIDPSTAWYLDVDFYTDGTQYYTDSAEKFSDVLANEVNVNVVSAEFSNIYNNNYDYALTLIVDPDSYSYGIFQGGRRIPGRIVSATKMIFEDAYISEGQNTYLAYAYYDGTDNHYVCIAHAGFDGNAAFVTMEFAQGEMTMSYISWSEMPNTWSNFYYDDGQNGTMIFGNNFGTSREEIDTTVFQAPQLQVAHYYKNEYDAVKDSSTFLLYEFLNAHSENISVDPVGEGDIDSTPFEYDPSTDVIPVTYYVRLTDASTGNVTQWQEMGNFPDINVGYGNEHIDSDSSVLYISSSPSNDALEFGYTQARFGVWTNAGYDASVSQGGMDETEFYIANMTLGPVNVENGYDASFNIVEGHSEFIGQCYNPTTQQYWGNINHMYGFDFPIPFEFKTTFNDQTYVVDASAILSAGHINDGWTQYKYGWYDRSAWENDENGIQEQYSGDENAYRMANVQGTNSYSTTTFTCTADNSKSYKFSVFAIPYRLDGDNNDEHDWEYFREATYDINM